MSGNLPIFLLGHNIMSFLNRTYPNKERVVVSVIKLMKIQINLIKRIDSFITILKKITLIKATLRKQITLSR